MQLKQVNMNYIPVEDRIVLRLNTADKAEFRFWLTRNVVSQLLSGLSSAEALLLSRETPETANPTALKAVQEFRKEATVAEADFKTEFAPDATTFPLGEAPQLVARFTFDYGEKSAAVAIALANRQVVTINLNAHLAVTVNKLLKDVVSKIDWNIPVKQAVTPVAMPAMPEILH